MDPLFSGSSNFSSLSLKDLLEARQLFHYHLMNKSNVVATAVGLYRIRKDDPWPSGRNRKEPPRSRHSPRRTLFNSEVRPYSWPCIYVFVSEWSEEDRLSRTSPSDVVPRSLFLPDGRSVPVCVIEARRQNIAKDLTVDMGRLTPRNRLGPGTILLNDDGQGMTRLGTAGCVVRDSQRYYVLTNRHVIGEPGTPIDALQVHRQPTVGISAPRSAGRVDFGKVYPHFASVNQRLLMDVGLVDLRDITEWSTQVPGIAEPGPVLDLFDNSFTLKLIGLKVFGYSGVSGPMRGEIQGLFYRFKAIGGFEYVADFLIGPESDPAGRDMREEKKGENVAFAVRHGDSGTLLFIEHKEEEPEEDGQRHKPKSKTVYRPFALLWGREEFFDGGRLLAHPFALATSLSTALDRFDLDVVFDINRDEEYVWGWAGHYLIGGTLPFIPSMLGSAKLRNFIKKNMGLLTVDLDDKLDNDPRVVATDGSNVDTPNFVQLADVPDNVWKSNVNFFQSEGDDGKKQRHPGPGSRGQNDNPNHFADLDLPFEKDGKDWDTFLDFAIETIADKPDPSDWLAYFAQHKADFDRWAKLVAPDKKPKPEQSHWGALPFRIWQLYDAMVAAAKAGKAEEFLTAGGVLIHYVGDACQPLHTSFLSQGDPERVVKRPKSDSLVLEANNVHSGYEDEMVNFGIQEKELGDLTSKAIARQENDPKEAIMAIAEGADAARATLRLVAATHATIAPRDIVTEWVKVKGDKKATREEEMWTAFGPKTAECMARGSRYLAAIWGAAWKAGGGDQTIGEGKACQEPDIMALYNNPKFVPSVRLDQYAALLGLPNAAADAAGAGAPAFLASPGEPMARPPRRPARHHPAEARER